MKVTRLCWAFLRTMVQDYRRGCPRLPDGTLGPYPWRKVGRGYCPYLRCFLMSPDLPQRVVLFETRRKALVYAGNRKERGHPVRVRVSIKAGTA